MTTVDNLYMDNLSEFIFDEKRVVTFKFLSVTLGVHVNIAKQMLYHFHETSKEAGKKIYATYYVSGAILQGRSIDPTVPETQDCHNPLSGPHGYVVTLCKDKDLDIVKQRIMKIHSVHIYALSAFPLDNLDILRKAMSDPIFKERNPVDFGPLHCKAAQKIRENPKEIKLPQELKSSNDSTTNTQNKKTGISVKSASDNIFSKSTPDEQNSGNNSSQPKAVSTAPSKKANEQSDSRLKNMFASAASKPRKTTPVIETKQAETFEKKLDHKKSTKAKESSSVRNSTKEKAVTSKGKQSESRKRKRIKDVLSSSSEDERASDDEDCSQSEPDSPNHRKRNLIESDSDEDIPEVVKKPRSDEPVEPIGRKKVSKTVSKTFMDKDGFLVTTKEQVMVSEPETSDTETGSASAQNASDAEQSKLAKSGSNKTEEKISDNKDTKTINKAKATKASNASTAAAKSKQSSLFSFFQKK